MKRLARYFLNGVILTAPVALTAFILWKVFTTVDGWLNIPIPGVGFLATIALITLVGFFGSNFLTRRLLDWLEDLLEHLPGVRFIYHGIKEVMGAFVGEKRRFGKAVLVTLDQQIGLKAIGFLTQESLAEFGLEDHVTVYLPQSYNFAGQTLVIPRDRIQPLDVPSARVMTFVVSGGVAEMGDR
ncbi:MAG: DUF502 domain-containing protein [Gemmatimonadales bacterium]|nr:MAG: DUF502 domain-containing protein [Gemmatimonadales bacterium]